ncbi:DUF1285 domain-containing protein [Parathalassolituus penaei]|uniref:DUF1285 domain-containing protein n=1 Tax=Parathalassolituus penaei TaxID=2997323 RepID=A0A9X3ED83_9GAMM|nr:DUF1285 domain-containing protein [Parathalassolituus penaei]MCY0965427.1 DUF1285 domain-containing protein [Parathalassolituus penaei]
MANLDELAVALRSHALPPVAQWHPELCGEIDIVIRADGRWEHEGGEFRRSELQMLFAGLLRREGGEYYLVTPAEKLRIRVEDQAFLITLIDVQDGCIELLTNCGERLSLGREHPLQFSWWQEVLLPMVEVRDGLFARFGRSAWYELVGMAEERDGGWWIVSDGEEYHLPDE